MISITSSKWNNLEGIGDDILRELRPQAERTLLKAQLELEGTIKRKLTGRRSGRTYRVSATGALHVASAPGEAPAKLHGNLGGSVGHSAPSWETGGFAVSGKVGPGLGHAPSDGSPDPGESYARRLEYGGADSRGVMIDPRPYMEPSVQEAEPRIDRIFEAELGSR